ncbi:MAG: stage IV sporulation protein A [Clostridia bacterium]|nr:stage IV sporulation protein A [Clostridia bacterium]
MANSNIYQDIAARTGGDIYIGVVGPVRTGKSTFIKKFMESMVLPNIEDSMRRDRATDELPQSSGGRTIMTTEPKFIPEDAVEISLPSKSKMKVRMIDCVGYIVPSALGYIEGEAPRMVKTPWFDEEVPFNMAAEIGTRKVISEHSTIGLVVTTDGSISEIPRSEYAEAETRVISELKELNKPFVVLLNCKEPTSPSSEALAAKMTANYDAPVIPVNCLELTHEEISSILSQILFEFPIKEIKIDMPGWITSLDKNHWLRAGIFSKISSDAQGLKKVRDIRSFADTVSENEHIYSSHVENMDLATGSAKIAVSLHPNLFFKIVEEETGISVENEQELMKKMKELSAAQSGYQRIQNALDEVEATGYGIVLPDVDDLTLEEPEIMKQGGRYGVRLRASAPSLHIMKADIQTEVAPIVGSESQSEELIKYLLKEFEENPAMIWESNIFGTSLHELVNEGLHNKLYRMPGDARLKLRETLERVINEGCSGLICIIL